MKRNSLPVAANMEQINQLMFQVSQLKNANYITAHNLRGAASNLKLLSEIILERENDDPTIYSVEACQTSGLLSNHELLEYINQCSCALLNTLNEMMKTTKQDLAPEDIFETCNIEKTVTNISAQLNGVIFQKHAKLVLHLAVKQIKYVKIYLESLLYNLISNAIKYSRSDVEPEIDISTYMNEGKPVLEVKDNGIGFDVSKVGDRLFKLNQTFHENRDSTGVGLFITKSQIESLGGHIIVNSGLNNGTTFTVVF